MIASVAGSVAAKGSDWVVIETPGGVGYRVEIVPQLAAKLHQGETAKVITQMIVREDLQALYGFSDAEQLAMFNVLLGVSGVGPRSALGVLAALNPQEIAQAVAAEDPKPFQQVSGIGPKSAKLILVSLAGKLDHIVLGGGSEPTQLEATATNPADSKTAQVLAGLVGLGWDEKSAAAAVAEAAKTQPESASELLKLSLKQLQNL